MTKGNKMSNLIKKTQYFLDGQQVISAGKELARELGVSENTLRRWVENSEFPTPLHSEPTFGGGEIHYYPYAEVMEILNEKLAAYKVNRAKGIGRPKKK